MARALSAKTRFMLSHVRATSAGAVRLASSRLPGPSIFPRSFVTKTADASVTSSAIAPLGYIERKENRRCFGRSRALVRCAF